MFLHSFQLHFSHALRVCVKSKLAFLAKRIFDSHNSFYKYINTQNFYCTDFFFENSRIACRFCFLRATNHCFHSCLPALLILMISHNFFGLSLCNCTRCFPEQFDIIIEIVVAQKQNDPFNSTLCISNHSSFSHLL